MWFNKEYNSNGEQIVYGQSIIINQLRNNFKDTSYKINITKNKSDKI